jgi:hypothetical protein
MGRLESTANDPSQMGACLSGSVDHRWLVGIHRRLHCIGRHRSYPVLPIPGDFPRAAGFRTDSLPNLTEAVRLVAPLSTHVGRGPPKARELRIASA